MAFEFEALLIDGDVLIAIFSADVILLEQFFAGSAITVDFE